MTNNLLICHYLRLGTSFIWLFSKLNSPTQNPRDVCTPKFRPNYTDFPIFQICIILAKFTCILSHIWANQ